MAQIKEAKNLINQEEQEMAEAQSADESSVITEIDSENLNVARPQKQREPKKKKVVEEKLDDFERLNLGLNPAYKDMNLQKWPSIQQLAKSLNDFQL